MENMNFEPEGIFDWPCYYFETVDSTIAVAKKMLKAGHIQEAGMIIAGHQTQGVGQRGNTWQDSPNSSLLCTFVIKDCALDRPRIVLRQPAHFTLCLAVSIVEAMETVRAELVIEEPNEAPFDTRNFAEHITIKWPNDILVYDKKIAGILAEKTQGTLLLSCGVNILSPENWQGSGEQTQTTAQARGEFLQNRAREYRFLPTALDKYLPRTPQNASQQNISQQSTSVQNASQQRTGTQNQNARKQTQTNLREHYTGILKSKLEQTLCKHPDEILSAANARLWKKKQIVNFATPATEKLDASKKPEAVMPIKINPDASKKPTAEKPTAEKPDASKKLAAEKPTIKQEAVMPIKINPDGSLLVQDMQGTQCIKYSGRLSVHEE